MTEPGEVGNGVAGKRVGLIGLIVPWPWTLLSARMKPAQVDLRDPARRSETRLKRKLTSRAGFGLFDDT
jgi:hypothetical protein